MAHGTSSGIRSVGTLCPRPLVRLGLAGAFAALSLAPGWAAAPQDGHLVTPGMPGSEDHHLNWPDLKIEWGLGVDLRAPISLGGEQRGGELEAGVRAVDLVLRSDFNRSVWGTAMVSGEADDLRMPRATLVYTGLSRSSVLRLGRMPIDFGKQMQARPYELPYPQRPAVLRAYLGDQVHATGLSYGDVFETGPHSTVRASIGLYSDWERTSDPLLEEVDPTTPVVALRDGPRLDELGLVARITGVVDVGPEGLLQWGLSAQGLPDYGLSAVDSGGATVRADGLSQWVYGADLTYGHADETEGPAWSAGWEGLLVSGDSGGQLGPGPSLETVDGDLFGHYLWVERQTRSGRGLGMVYSHHEVPLSGQPTSQEWSLYFSRPLIENALMRFVVQHTEREGAEESQALLVQFVALAGSLGHGLDW